MPTAYKVQVVPESLLDLQPLGLDIGRIGISAPAVAAARARSLDDVDERKIEACE